MTLPNKQNKKNYKEIKLKMVIKKFQEHEKQDLTFTYGCQFPPFPE